MATIDGSVTIDVGDRKVSLVLNGRAGRLIFEKTGVDVYRNPRGLQTLNADNLPYLLWALTQNKRNGKPEEWPSVEDVEELQHAEVIEAIFLAVVPPEKREQVRNLLAKARTQPEQITEELQAILATSTSGHSAEPNLDSPGPNGMISA